MKLKLPRVNKYAVMLVGAFALAIVAVLLLHSYLTQQKSQYQKELASQLSAGMVQVVVPTRNLVPGTVASGQNMAERLYPQDLIYSGTITAAKWQDYAGRTLARPVQQGKPLLESDFVAKANHDFASTLPKTMRAVTIDVDTLNSINGLVRPDDRVDVLLTGDFGPKSSSGAGGQRQVAVLPLLRLVKVLAVGHRFLGEHLQEQQADEGVQQANAALPMSYSTVTLEVSPQQASELILAQQVGTLRVVLSNLRSAPPTALQVPRMDQAQLLAKLTGAVNGTGASEGVQYIIGQGNGGISQNYVPTAVPAAAVAAQAQAQKAAAAAQRAAAQQQQEQQQQALQKLKQMMAAPKSAPALSNPPQSAQ